MPAILNPCGAVWWRKNQTRYPNSRDINTLEPTFLRHVSAFISALRAGGASVVVSSTRRSPQRAYLMHYAWLVATGQIEPSRVPPRPGVIIDWDLGDDKASRKGAQEMVDLAGMAYVAALSSNHTRGTAIDMNISWKGSLTLKGPGSAPPWQITSTPRTGAGNTDLHAVAATVFAIRKLKSDPPHWSFNGR